ncbi:SH3 domain-containing protein [Streptomyces sp. NPDC053048]|uniref:SH3 domain-containing protein n=1 Tax=Streptomyces sp. NPDC053048 TaxID=3365694 RepID=UPI0037D87C51
MFSTLAVRCGKASAGVLAAAALGGSLLAVVPAQAAPPARPYGAVTASSGINERVFPTTDSAVKGVIKYHAQVPLRCKARAQDVAGNAMWYLVRDRNTWVAGRYVDTTGEIPVCRTLTRGALDDSAESRRAMG